MSVISVKPNPAARGQHIVEVDGVNLTATVPVRRWTVDQRAGETPTLYVETADDVAIEGVEGVVVHNVVGGPANIAEWLATIDPEALDARVIDEGDMDESGIKTALRILTEMANAAGG